ncbi:hypothetical protein MJO28_012863 [Puccinia striiformis f. sp. tritici]|uniref:Uncharacterized protein n=1 Tax=Puccinia striiformis f. sp. tritici TaxID=168172 RepID=A0ACC0DWL9_9BASI|nr:hypothetical protein MJO28_012863 [Puccinia striiformis f. sp. tritici]KAI9620899.1 hypothetical protein H4Q26_013574 [Puccinia striiformis f. sp. tritici PST-130]
MGWQELLIPFEDPFRQRISPVELFNYPESSIEPQSPQRNIRRGIRTSPRPYNAQEPLSPHLSLPPSG